MRGKLLIVAKRSIWNGQLTTADDRHSQMTAQEIRAQIQHATDIWGLA